MVFILCVFFFLQLNASLFQCVGNRCSMETQQRRWRKKHAHTVCDERKKLSINFLHTLQYISFTRIYAHCTALSVCIEKRQKDTAEQTCTFLFKHTALKRLQFILNVFLVVCCHSSNKRTQKTKDCVIIIETKTKITLCVLFKINWHCSRWICLRFAHTSIF